MVRNLSQEKTSLLTRAGPQRRRFCCASNGEEMLPEAPHTSDDLEKSTETFNAHQNLPCSSRHRNEVPWGGRGAGATPASLIARPRPVVKRPRSVPFQPVPVTPLALLKAPG